MATLPQDGEFGTYAERRPRIVRKSMKVGEQVVGLEGRALAEALDDAAKVSTAENASGDEEPEANPAGPAPEPTNEAPEQGQAADVEPAQPEVKPAATADVAPDADEPPQPVEQEPVTPATDPGATDESVTLTKAEYDELKRGNLMQADYTRKTQATADLRKELDQMLAQTRAERDQYLSLIKQVEELLAGSDKEPDWAELRRTLPPDEYADARDIWAKRTANLKDVQAERERVQQSKDKDARAQREKAVEDERERLFTAMPDLRDQKTLTPWLKRMHATAKSIGFTDAEFDSVVDHRLFLLLNQAAKGAPVPSTKPQTTKPPVARPRSVGPGATPRTVTPQNKRDEKLEALKGKKSVEAAGEYFATLDI